MPTHAGHKHIILVQVFKANRASKHAVHVPLGAASRGLCSIALRPYPCPKHAGSIEVGGSPWVTDIEHLGNACNGAEEESILQ